ncbi:Uncharacterised protein [BD1-7 clade bacterium]|nr:Uncharacterised protein [BD1-7 clade bacterium]
MNSILLQKEVNVGVDTGKHQLDVHIRPLDIFFTVENTNKGIKKAIRKIHAYSNHYRSNRKTGT